VLAHFPDSARKKRARLTIEPRIELGQAPLVRLNGDELQQAYKQAVDGWVAAIRAEEALATPDHSETAMEKWDAACFGEQDAQKKAQQAKDAYKDALRNLHYKF